MTSGMAIEVITSAPSARRSGHRTRVNVDRISRGYASNVEELCRTSEMDLYSAVGARDSVALRDASGNISETAK